MFPNKVLTEKDLEDGKKIKELFESLGEEEKNMALIYMSALRDRSMIQQTGENAGAAGQKNKRKEAKEIQMWVSKKKWNELNKKIADLENRIQSQQEQIRNCEKRYLRNHVLSAEELPKHNFFS